MTGEVSVRDSRCKFKEIVKINNPKLRFALQDKSWSQVSHCSSTLRILFINFFQDNKCLWSTYYVLRDNPRERIILSRVQLLLKSRWAGDVTVIDDSSCQTFLMIHPILNFSNCSALIIRFGFLAGQTYTKKQIRTLKNHKSDWRMFDCPKLKIF